MSSSVGQVKHVWVGKRDTIEQGSIVISVGDLLVQLHRDGSHHVQGEIEGWVDIDIANLCPLEDKVIGLIIDALGQLERDQP